MSRIESFLSARLFLVPQLVGDQIYFVSNLNGRNSLYVMDRAGSVPTPLLPPDLALQNPHLMNGLSFRVFPGLGKILVMLDQDGDEIYQPMFIPQEGGYPEPYRPDLFAGQSIVAAGEDLESNRLFFVAQSRTESIFRTYLADLGNDTVTLINESQFGGTPAGGSADYSKIVLAESYGVGDVVLFHYDPEGGAPRPFFGTPITQRQPGEPVPPNGIFECHFIRDNSALLVACALFSDTYGLAMIPLDDPSNVQEVTISGIRHDGIGELTHCDHLHDDRYLVGFNIDGSDWRYEGQFDEDGLTMTLTHLLVGDGKLHGGVIESMLYNKAQDCYILSFSTAVSPTQIYILSGPDRDQWSRHTGERILAIPETHLSPGEEYPFTSYDGLRISARLYLPAAELGYAGARPLVYYIHGGPTSQERPDFAWFSMPFIQFLTLNGFAVFVPNVRGSTGYGFKYMQHVIRDWGGADRLDHLHAMTEVLSKDARIDTSRAGVVGRSYGGYMTLTLAARHPELWSAAIDMFGPYDLLTFAQRVPETWKPFIKMQVGDPETEADFLIERSPRTYIDNVQCPMLVIQGKNDPRVIEKESSELVEELRKQGKAVDYLMFPDEGHDVLKYENRVTVYNRMTAFFREHLHA